MKFAFLILGLISTSVFADETIRTVGYDRISLAGDEPESVVFYKYGRGERPEVYGIGYMIGEKVIRVRGMPKDMYIDLMSKLQTNVLQDSPRDEVGYCLDPVILTQAPRKQVTPVTYCLGNAHAKAALLKKNFHAWYRNVRNLLAL